jgi:hypothetical protein
MIDAMLRSFLLVILFCTGIRLDAREIFIAPGGSDRNPGTRELPLASLTGARDLIRQIRSLENLNEAIHVVVTDGHYFITEPLVLSPEDSGSDSFPVVYRADAGARPVFTGGMAITNWEKTSEHIWRAKVPEVSRFGFYFEQLYVDGQRAVRAKSPNKGFYFLDRVVETVVSKGNGRVPDVAVQKLKVLPEAAADFTKFSKSDFEDAVLTLYHKWDNTRKRVSGFDSDSLVVFTAGKGMKPWNSLDKKTRYTVENFKAALDTVGEWYLERNGDLLYFPGEEKNPNQMKIYVPVTERFVTLLGNVQTG